MKESAIENTANELKNPLPDKIPNIVCDDLLPSEKTKIFEVIENKYSITYYHTERHSKKDDFADTDVIKIDKDSSESANVQNTFDQYDPFWPLYIYSMATSERGKIKLANPVPEIIPCHIWNNLPDVLKEEIDASIKYRDYKNYHHCRIDYFPDKNILGIYKSTGDDHFRTLSSHAVKYDSKRGVLLHCEIMRN
jgi:hypothetical protein